MLPFVAGLPYGVKSVFRAPVDSRSFPALLRELEAQKAALGVRSYGVSITTMEEVRWEGCSGRTASIILQMLTAKSPPAAASPSKLLADCPRAMSEAWWHQTACTLCAAAQHSLMHLLTPSFNAAGVPACVPPRGCRVR